MSEQAASPAAGAAPGSDAAPGTEPIGIDPEASDDDSAIDFSDRISTESITSSIIDYRKLHGRTYHNYKGAVYWGPNDDQQNEGLDIAHQMMLVALDNRLFLAPLQDPQKVLDIGTGTGIWAIDFADQFSAAEVTGIDISPIQPSWVPPNCKFQVDNCEMDWTFGDDMFDYIYIRGLAGCIEDWPKLYRQCFQCLKPGGLLEHWEFALPIAGYEGPLPDNCVWHDWQDIFRTAGKKMGRTFEVTEKWETWMREAGFNGDIPTKEVKLPIGQWARGAKWKDVGGLNRLSLEAGLDGFARYLCTEILGWGDTAVSVMLAEVRKAIRDSSYHAYYPLKIAYTQKPKV